MARRPTLHIGFHGANGLAYHIHAISAFQGDIVAACCRMSSYVARSRPVSDVLMRAAFDTPDLSPTVRLTLIALARFASDKRPTCNPMIRTLMDRTGLGRSTLLRSISYLVEEGLIEKKAVHRPNGTQSSDVYTIKIGPYATHQGSTVKPCDLNVRVSDWDPDQGSTVKPPEYLIDRGTKEGLTKAVVSSPSVVPFQRFRRLTHG